MNERGLVTEVQPAGLCGCGCGLPAPIAIRTTPSRGHTRGQPIRFIRGHSSRTRPRQDPTERFWSKVDKNGPVVRSELGPCWLWTDWLDKDRYGHFGVDGRCRRAHQVVLELAGWIIPAEFLQVLHRCDNPPCVNPAHLRIGTPQDDADDKVSKGRQLRGERHSQAKLEQVDANEIRRLYRTGGLLQEDLSRQFGVSQSRISKIVRGEAWRPG